MKALERRAWGALNPVLAFGLVLAVLVVFYLGETLVDHEHIREHERLHMQQEIVQLQSELTQLQHTREADKEQIARTLREKEEKELGDAASARNKDPEIVLGSPVSQDRKQLPPLSVKRKLPTGAMGESLANRPPFLEKAMGKAWRTPAYDAEVAARARGGSVKNDDLSERRRAAVREAMRHSWQGYKKYAYGEDELEPITRTGSNAFGHLGATAIDAIDTLWLMGLEKEYLEARELVADFPKRMMEASPLSTFECTIRVLGGFMSTYYLTGDELYLNNARELGDRLLFAYSRKGVGIPSGYMSLHTLQGSHPSWLGSRFLLAEFGTTQLEFYALSKETGDMKYAKASAKPLEAVHGMYPNSFLLPTNFNNLGEIIPPMRYTMGAMADSYYEYLLKAWVQAGSHRDEMVHDTGRRWERSMEAMSRFLVYRYKGFTALQEVGGAFDEKVPNSHLGKISKSMDHLSCFVPGMLGLGVYKARDLMTSSQQVKFLKLAEDLTQTCYLFYHSTSTGLSGDAYSYHADKILPAGAQNLLRPETVESLMILYRATGNNKYREWGWEIFQAFEKHCKVEAGYSGVTDVTRPSAELDNKMQSWFLAETLKYLYLLFSPSDVLSLDEWVFNTEAHPMMIW